MRKICAYAAFGVLASIAISPSPATAFGLRIGPLAVGLPFFGHMPRSAHRRHLGGATPGRVALVDKAELGAGGRPQMTDGALFYPRLALTGILDDVFVPERTAPWPFGYHAMFRTAFEKGHEDQEAQACRQPAGGNVLASRIAAEIKPTKTQRPLLQKLGAALGAASGYLSRACPSELPAQPVARLKLIQAQIQTLTMALDGIRPPLQQLEQSLNAQQRGRMAAAAAPACDNAADAADTAVDQIGQAVQTSEDQRDALADLRNAFSSAAADLAAHCPKSPMASPLGRLEATEARLDASWRAALAMQAALGKFEAGLSDQQRSRFEAMDVAAAH